MYQVEMRHITKTFPSVVADDDVDFFVEEGEIHALMGENGAGKSILMSILAGLYRPDSGEIFVGGQRRVFTSPLDAIAAGIGMVFQEFQLFGSMTLAENIIFRQEPTRRGLIDQGAANAKVRAISQRYGLEFDPAAKAANAPVGVLQRAEIVKALYRDAKILILDEPTAVLTPQETVGLFKVLRELRAEGHTIVFITHKLREVMEISDRVTVLRDGKVVARLDTAKTTPDEISHAMTGRAIDLTMRPPTRQPGADVLAVRGLGARSDRGVEVLRGVDLTVRAGEIVGLAGVAGNGQAELAQVLSGLAKASTGTVELGGKDITAAKVARRRELGLSYIPEDRWSVGAAGPASVAENLAMGHHRAPPIRPRRLLSRRAMRSFAAKLIDQFSIKVPAPQTLAGTLSGGNLQKLVAARELAHEAPLLIAEQPTRGVDIGSIEFIHGQLVDYRDRGGAVLLISAELSEILSLSGRIAVMYEGRIVAVLNAGQATEDQIGLLMAGVTAGTPPPGQPPGEGTEL
ncbi:MAG: ABC transporter ATP-binding protein [Bifidobacteriaceae bacterium]|jgi:simple sugar transport system ATP-binding protein|nr:ABC transporter ATP-binding protein [Bifidobacteriaceae bacterium]